MAQGSTLITVGLQDQIITRIPAVSCHLPSRHAPAFPTQKLPTCTFRSLSTILRPGAEPHGARTAPGLPPPAPPKPFLSPQPCSPVSPGCCSSNAQREHSPTGDGVGAPQEATAAALYLRCPKKHPEWSNPFSSRHWRQDHSGTSPGEGAGGNHPAKKQRFPCDRILPSTAPANLPDSIRGPDPVPCPARSPEQGAGWAAGGPDPGTFPPIAPGLVQMQGLGRARCTWAAKPDAKPRQSIGYGAQEKPRCWKCKTQTAPCGVWFCGSGLGARFGHRRGFSG